MVKNHFNADAVSAVSDPTDFPPLTTAPGLRQLDNALRCNICRELFEGPVTLPCGHCFCSIVRHVPFGFPATERSLTGTIRVSTSAFGVRCP